MDVDVALRISFDNPMPIFLILGSRAYNFRY